MNKSKTKYFILEYETGLSKKDRDICEKKLRIGRSIYNACLGEALKRLRKCHNDPNYKKFAKNYKESESILISLKDELENLKNNSGENKIRANEINSSILKIKDILDHDSNALNVLTNQYRCSGKYSLYDFRKKQSAHFKGSIGAQIASKLSERAFLTAKKIIENKSERVRYVRDDDDFTIEGAGNHDSIYMKNGRLYFDRKTVLEIKPSRKNDDEYYEEAIQNRIKHCLLTSRTIRGKKRYFLQVLFEGTPPIHRYYGDETIDLLDVKISHLEIYINGSKRSFELAPGCKEQEEKISKINQMMDASRRATNPDNYNEDGTIKKGTKGNWVKSKNYCKLSARKKELFRSIRERRKVSHEELSNAILNLGTDIYVKKLSYKEQQMRKKKDEIDPLTGIPKSKARQGKAIRNRAPGTFVAILERKLSYIDKKLNYILP